MSIKTKLSAIIFGSVLLFLALQITYNSISTREKLREDSERNMRSAAMQVAVSVEQSSHNSKYVEEQIAHYLRLAAVVASEELDPDIANVTPAQLKALAARLEVSNISLLVRTPDDIIIAKSSDPNEVNLSTRGWGFWHSAFEELFDLKPVSQAKGEAMDHFWSGPFEYSSSSPEYIEKWGYYYDGRANYMIDPYLRSTSISNYVQISSPEEVVRLTRQVNPNMLEITGINPDTFGGATMAANGSDSANTKLRNRPIKFGTYRYSDVKDDKTAIARAMVRKQPVTTETVINGRRVLKSFIPVTQTDTGTYLIRIVADYSGISSALGSQLRRSLFASMVLLLLSVVVSHLLSNLITRPFQAILAKVNAVSRGEFEPPLVVGSRDELGQLALRINAMTHNLSQHTTQLGRTLEENRAVKEHLESVINGTTDAIHTVDLTGRILSVNRAFEEIYGWPSEEAVGRKDELVPESCREAEAARLAAIERGQQLAPKETVRQRKDGTLVEVSVSTSIIRDDLGRPLSFVHVSRDMSERNRMEELLRNSEKLTTVGQLAAGVAHEIRNPLTTLRGFLQLQRERRSIDLQHVDLMLSELERINLIVGEFLILAKPQAVLYQHKSIRRILGDVLSLLDSQANLHGIVFRTLWEEQDAQVYGEENQLKQVFINVLKNAIEAMEDGGTITLEQYSQSGNVVIIITDEGEGIPEELLPKLGEPFFTRKETGTGLGVMVSQRIIQAHKGTMDITSKAGEGTRVTIILPAAPERRNDTGGAQPHENQ
ncbi:PAS domain S-box protein [Paenibacillus spiritus]|uniref:histidine kinase n=1 Tax=Paenibacillus spiritus TaxID=2496557 RepID=A0A5J5GB06_9BACL|nr:ATP-binding protein [Paenibacillus spiritus]KAA9004654.1 PAS domain S-box protein [Paenibacillus spiritus]